MRRRLSMDPLLLGLVVGLVFGSVDLMFTWLDPLEDDTPGVLLRFYGPMFLVSILVSFRTARVLDDCRQVWLREWPWPSPPLVSSCF